MAVVGIDADDTLWHNETYFADAQATFVQILAPWTPEGEDVLALHDATERANLELFGYGIKGFTLSMVETAIEVSRGEVSTSAIAELIRLGKEMLAHPVELLEGVADAVEELGRTHRLVLVTKGDLIHQEQKIARSGLADRFERIEIVSEKDPATYRAILDRMDVSPEQFCMVGNSVKSDVLPVLELGGHAVHVPYAITWSHEVVADHDADAFPVLASLTELAAWLQAPQRSVT
ncbi:HAD family hydrolase [Iamia sp. SCSIO 61187]|uniref:HAD family hydrolase n=1 Tax=Iamia sp. SCSIO 61187 TaxID=2722752 RepID=UPI001C637BEA|nr:HAD family hydrolase [Iamia sp. SCSIO 61187]